MVVYAVGGIGTLAVALWMAVGAVQLMMQVGFSGRVLLRSRSMLIPYPAHITLLMPTILAAFGIVLLKLAWNTWRLYTTD